MKVIVAERWLCLSLSKSYNSNLQFQTQSFSLKIDKFTPLNEKQGFKFTSWCEQANKVSSFMKQLEQERILSSFGFLIYLFISFEGQKLSTDC